jgi:hypothetical protein
MEPDYFTGGGAGGIILVVLDLSPSFVLGVCVSGRVEGRRAQRACATSRSDVSKDIPASTRR